MAFAGMASVPNYDGTAQTSGVPISSGRTNHHEEEDIAAANQKTVDTAATSVTDVAASDSAHKKSSNPQDSDKISAEDDEDSEIERRHSLVQSLARKYSHASATGSVGGNPFFAEESSPLNPNSPNFNGRAWARAIVDLVAQNGASFRTSGVAFQNLNVFGFGQATDYQKDVGNIWLSVAGLARKFTGGGKTRIDILRSFDGLVRKGEMLVVLGPPGSGCSTFLKTIAGETNGLYTDDTSYFNYQGK
ncbi:ABC transporter CDR4, partial [Colletotrichum tanaceti]